MRQLIPVPRFTFVIGKGGVGKTTIASALALHAAAKSPRSKFLLLSTDPAHSLSDLLQLPLGDRPRKMKTTGALYARQLDAPSAVAQFLDAQREGILRILESGSLFTRDELEPLLESALPGMAEVAALLTIHDLLASDYDEVFVDTAPMGHTLRLFELPAHLERFLKLLEVAASRDNVLAAHFGGRTLENPFLLQWQQMVSEVVVALDATHTRLLLVTSPEEFSLNEALRAREQLRGSSVQLDIDEVVLNRAVLTPGKCPRCKRLATRTQKAKQFLKREFGAVPLRIAADPGAPILGAEALRAFGGHVFQSVPLRLKLSKLPKTNELEFEECQWPSLEVPLTLTLGKGGVGKTTVSAGLAYQTRNTHPDISVSLCSIDPAPSLDDILTAAIRNEPRTVLRDRKFFAAEIDAITEYRRWADEMQLKVEAATSTEVRGVHLDLSFERDLFLAVLDVVPPGVDEIFAAFRILDLVDRGGRVQIDMAPTGHALEVLRTPARLLGWTRVLLKTLAHHRTLPLARDAAVEIATVSQRVRELSSALTDPQRSAVWVVMLAEPLPDQETRRLLADLKSMQAPVSGIFVNRVLMRPTSCSRCANARAWQYSTLANLRKSKLPIFVVPEFDGEPKGKSGLARLTETLWRLQ